MEQITRYDSIEELKADSKPASPDDAQSAQRHERFMEFIDFLTGDDGKDTEPATDKPAVNPGPVYGL